MNVSGFDPSQLDVVRLADRAQTIRGRWPGAAMERLAQDATGVPGDVEWSVRGEFLPAPGSKPELWLHLQIDAQVPMTCQRCLRPVALALNVARRIRFVRDEAEAERLDEEGEDDVMSLSPKGLDLKALVEDELILALPLVPRHEDCAMPMPAAKADTAIDIEARANPFQVLAALKRAPRGGDPE